MKSIAATISNILLASILFAVSTDVAAERRALLIGISAYANVQKLDNPLIDVEHVSSTLRRNGYVVTKIKDPDTSRDKLLRGFSQFLKTINQGDEVVVYYSGHGVDIRGADMFVPADSPASQDIAGEFELSQQLVSMRELMTEIEDHQPAIQIWIVDACRENPYAGGGRPYAASGGLRRLDGENTRPNSFLLFAANYSQIARDRLPSERPGLGLGSPFSRTFVSIFEQWKDKDINLFASELRREVVTLVKPDPQFPMYENGILGQWCFSSCSSGLEQVAIAGKVDASSAPGFVQKTAGGITRVDFTASGENPANAPPYASLVGDQSVVFLGKESSSGCADGSISDLFPFGCKVLRRLSEHFGGGNIDPSDGLVGQAVTVTTGSNVRRGLPRTGSNGTIYGCKVRVLTEGQSIRIASTVALKYAGDTFYWGVIDEPVQKCAVRQ